MISYSVLLFLTFSVNCLSLPDHVLRWSALTPSESIEKDQHFTLELGLDEEWASFKQQYKIGYNSAKDESFRKSVFERNLRAIKMHNYLYSKNLSSYDMAVNKFSDMTPDEFKAFVSGFKRPKDYSPSGTTFLGALNTEIPDSVDWTTKGYVTPVKNQGACGSCWAFSATGALEGQHFRKTGNLVSLSEQNLVDCSSAFGNYGCSGGLMDRAFEYIKKNGGIDTEESYPYEAVDGDCRFSKADIGATVTGYVDIPSGSEIKLTQAIAEVGPVSVAIDAAHTSFQHYSKGVFDEPKCSSDQLDHGVLAVGYGNENGKDYYMVKNSWGTSWGDHGFIKMVRNKKNQCGIATAASYPLV